MKVDKCYHSELCNGRNYLSLLRLKLIHVSKWRPKCEWLARLPPCQRQRERERERAFDMMTSWNGNIFRVTGHCAGNSPVPCEFPAQRPVTQSFDAFLDLRLNKRLSKQSRGWWFETPSHSLWRHRNEVYGLIRYVNPNNPIIEPQLNKVQPNTCRYFIRWNGHVKVNSKLVQQKDYNCHQQRLYGPLVSKRCAINQNENDRCTDIGIMGSTWVGIDIWRWDTQ